MVILSQSGCLKVSKIFHHPKVNEVAPNIVIPKNGTQPKNLTKISVKILVFG